jgi:hypothetical protein
MATNVFTVTTVGVNPVAAGDFTKAVAATLLKIYEDANIGPTGTTTVVAS